jgi:hypothetical protein
VRQGRATIKRPRKERFNIVDNIFSTTINDTAIWSVCQGKKASETTGDCPAQTSEVNVAE